MKTVRPWGLSIMGFGVSPGLSSTAEPTLETNSCCFSLMPSSTAKQTTPLSPRGELSSAKHRIPTSLSWNCSPVEKISASSNKYHGASSEGPESCSCSCSPSFLWFLGPTKKIERSSRLQVAFVERLVPNCA